MAISKEVVLDNGIILNYHRIVSVNNITNHASIIEVASYISEEKREEEKTALENKTGMNVYIDTQYIHKEYEKELNVDTAYTYIKTLEKFENSIDC